MADAEESRLILISNQLNAMVSEGRTDDTVTILCNLRDEDISVKLLKKTQIGRAVNNVRRNSGNAEVISLAKKIVNKWKRSAESQISSVVSTTGELPNSQMSQMTEETQMSQSQQTAGHPKPKEHHKIKKERREEKETELTQDSESLLPPTSGSALLLLKTETTGDKGTGLASTQNKDAEQEHLHKHDSDRVQTSHKQGQDNLLLQQTQQSNDSERPNAESYTGNKTSLTTGLVEGIRTTSPSDEGMSRERGSDDYDSQQTHLSEEHQSQQASVHGEKNSARAEEGHPRASTSTNDNNNATTQNTGERPLTELQSLRRDVSQIQKQVARIESVLSMLFTPLKQNLDRVSRKLSCLEQRQTARNSQNALSSHDALAEAETQAYPDWLGTLNRATSSPSTTGSNRKTCRPQSSSQHSLLPLGLKVKSEPVDHGYDLAIANDEMPVSQETGSSPSQLLFPQMTEDGGIRLESLGSDTEENKTTADPKPGPSTEPDIIPRKKQKLEHRSKESLSSWLPVGSVRKSSAFRNKGSDAAGLKVVRAETDSEDDLSGNGLDDSDQEGEPVPSEFKKPTVITPVKNVVRGPSQEAPLQEFACFTQVVDSMEDTEECTQEEARLLREGKGKLRKAWNQQCKKAAGTPYSALGKNQGRGQLKAIHDPEVGKEAIKKVLFTKVKKSSQAQPSDMDPL